MGVLRLLLIFLFPFSFLLLFLVILEVVTFVFAILCDILVGFILSSYSISIFKSLKYSGLSCFISFSSSPLMYFFIFLSPFWFNILVNAADFMHFMFALKMSLFCRRWALYLFFLLLFLSAFFLFI